MIDGTVNGKGIKGKVTKIPQIDKTLSLADKAAEAKATGEALNKKVDKTSIADNLTTADAAKVLSAQQGVDLKALIDKEVQDRKVAVSAETNERRGAVAQLVEDNAASFTEIDRDIGSMKTDIATAKNDINALGADVARIQDEVNSISPKTAFTYSGDGSTEARQITVGYDCHAILVTSVAFGRTLVGIITGICGVMVAYNDPFTEDGLLNVNATYSGGELYIYPRPDGKHNDHMNALGYTYTCIPL